MSEIKIPEGWEEFYRESNGKAHKEKWGTVNIRFPHLHLEFGELIVEFLPTFLVPETPVGIILIRPKEEDDGKEDEASMPVVISAGEKG